jgi:hypothetical protein
MPVEIESVFPEALKSRKQAIEKRIQELESENLHPNPEFRTTTDNETAKLKEELQSIDRTMMEMGLHD